MSRRHLTFAYPTRSIADSNHMTRCRSLALIAIAAILVVGLSSVAKAQYRRYGRNYPSAGVSSRYGSGRFGAGRDMAARGVHFERDSLGRLRDVWYDGRPDGLVYDHRPGRLSRIGWNPWISPFNPWWL